MPQIRIIILPQTHKQLARAGQTHTVATCAKII